MLCAFYIKLHISLIEFESHHCYTFWNISFFYNRKSREKIGSTYSVNEIIQSLKNQFRDFFLPFLIFSFFDQKKNFFSHHHQHRLSSVVFIENELDFFFHLHFFDILTGKKNFEIFFGNFFSLTMRFLW